LLIEDVCEELDLEEAIDLSKDRLRYKWISGADIAGGSSVAAPPSLSLSEILRKIKLNTCHNFHANLCVTIYCPQSAANFSSSL